MTASVVAVSLSPRHKFSKQNQMSIRLVAGLGVEGDAHSGATVKHRSRARFNPALPNLRQVHLIHEELFAELHARGFSVRPGEMGENITTRGIGLLALPAGTLLRIGNAELKVTGLRNPCIQIDRFQQGLMQAVLDRGADGNLIRKTGVMSVVLAGGDIRPGDAIAVTLPPLPHVPLRPV